MPSREETLQATPDGDDAPAPPSDAPASGEREPPGSSPPPPGSSPPPPGSSPPPPTAPPAAAPQPAPDEFRLNIKHIQESPRAENVLELKDVTVHWYETTIDFRFDDLDRALSRAWLRPDTALGVFARIPTAGRDALHVVLGLHGERSLCTYDYEGRRPVFHQVMDLIVETVAIRYHANSEGKLCFTTAGGRVRIKDARLHEFHARFLDIPTGVVRAQTFEPATLHDLVHRRFKDTLRQFQIDEPSSEEYKTVDRAAFQSRTTFNPNAGRVREVLEDPKAKWGSFESELPVLTDDLADQLTVGFSVRASSGSVRLSFPSKVTFKRQLKTASEQTQAFYSLVKESIDSIFDHDYSGRRSLLLAERDLDLGLFPELRSAGFVEALRVANTRRVLFLDLDLTAPREKWITKLLALESLMSDADVAAHVNELALEYARRVPADAASLVFVCRDTPGLTSLGDAAASALQRERSSMQLDTRKRADEAILAWAVHADADAWKLDPSTNTISVRSVAWQADELEYDDLPVVLAKLLVVLHSRLLGAKGDVGPDLARIAWCVDAARELSPHLPDLHTGLQLIAAKLVPTTLNDGARLLRAGVATGDELDAALLEQFSAPTWPDFRAEVVDGRVVLRNVGIGAARSVRVLTGRAHPAEAASDLDLPPNASVQCHVETTVQVLDLEFSKYGRRLRASLPVRANDSLVATPARSAPARVVSRKRIESQRRYRTAIDTDGIVLGASPATFDVFEQITRINLIGGPVLLLGEPGVGKTHIAELIHKSSTRAAKPFRYVSAAASGGDAGLQRADWVGVAKKSGIHGAHPDGRRGYFEEAEGGTLFIDEFAELSHEVQLVLLSVLEGRSVERVGGGSYTPNVRVIFATNADVAALVAGGKLRKDLKDRVPQEVRVAPLRDRPDDIVPLARKFTGDDVRITDRALLALVRHTWPENVRGMDLMFKDAHARRQMEKANVIDLEHLTLPNALVDAVAGLDDAACKRELWLFADRLARAQGYEQGKGLQRRVADILDVSEALASSVYSEMSLSAAAA